MKNKPAPKKPDMERDSTSDPTTLISHPEIDKALERIGGQSLDHRMRWVLNLSQCDLDTVSEGDLLNLQHEIQAFGIASGFPSALLESNKTHTKTFSFCFEIPVSGKTPMPTLLRRMHHSVLEGPPLPTLEALRECQAMVKGALEPILDKRGWWFEMPAMRPLVLNPISVEDADPTWHVFNFDGRPAVAFLLSLLNLLAGGAHRVRRCPGCQTIFLIDRRNQEYCSTRCQSRQATQAYRERHGMVTGRPRGRPRKEVVKATKKKSKPVTKGGGKRGQKRRQ